jgi:hypothetical protein
MFTCASSKSSRSASSTLESQGSMHFQRDMLCAFQLVAACNDMCHKHCLHITDIKQCGNNTNHMLSILPSGFQAVKYFCPHVVTVTNSVFSRLFENCTV